MYLKYCRLKFALDYSDAAILLVSASFASSEFINQVELAEFLKRKKEQGYLILPILLRNYDFKDFADISSLNFFKTYYDDYGLGKLSDRDKLMPFDVLGDDEKVNRKSLNDYFFKLSQFIHHAVTNHLQDSKN
jgi:hypothetical protein